MLQSPTDMKKSCAARPLYGVQVIRMCILMRGPDSKSIPRQVKKESLKVSHLLMRCCGADALYFLNLIILVQTIHFQYVYVQVRTFEPIYWDGIVHLYLFQVLGNIHVFQDTNNDYLLIFYQEF